MSGAFSQQDADFSQYMFNHHSVNPGYAGSEDMVCMSLLNRQQWVGFDGAPNVTIFSVNAPFRLFGTSSGAGLTILSDQLGNDNNLGLNASYAYRTEIGQGTLGIGLGIGMINRALKANWFIPAGIDGLEQPETDNLIPVNDESQIVFDLGLGLFYRVGNLYAGLSTTHLNEAKVKYATTDGSSFVKRHYYLTAGYTIQLPNPLFEITPSILIQSDGQVSHYHLNGMLRYNNKLWGGVTYKPGEAIVAMVGLELFNGIKVGYSYDYSTTTLQSYSGGSHEFMIGYCFSISIDRSPERYKSVRFL